LRQIFENWKKKFLLFIVDLPLNSFDIVAGEKQSAWANTIKNFVRLSKGVVY